MTIFSLRQRHRFIIHRGGHRRGSRLALILGLMAIFSGIADGISMAGDMVFERYQIILDRQPFGREPPPPPTPPPPPPPPPPPISPQESFARDLRLTFIVRNDRDEIRVGIVNERSKKSYIMEIGDIEDDMKLVSVDFDSERALLQHDDQEAWLSMDGQTPETGRVGNTPPPGRPGRSTAPPRPPPGAISRYRQPPSQPPPRPSLTREEYQRTRAERPPPRPPRAALAASRNPEQEGPPDVEGLSPAERERVLREYNLELIRAGGNKGPPLPIQLTDEEDARLVEEGVLPPLD